MRAEGYKLSFKDDRWPEEYFEKNNKSAIDNMDFTWQQLCDWKRKGVVLQSRSKAHCVSPLSVASRLQAEEIKRRRCLDLSRHINILLKKEPVKLSTLEKAIDILLPGDEQATYDLASAYHHVSIHPDHRTLLGCCAPHPETGEDTFFVFACMPFGLYSYTCPHTHDGAYLCLYHEAWHQAHNFHR